MNCFLVVPAVVALLTGQSVAQEVLYKQTDERNTVSFVDEDHKKVCCYCYVALSYSVSNAGEQYTFTIDSVDASGMPVHGQRLVAKDRTFIADDGGLYWCQNEAPWALYEAVPAPCGSVFPPS